MASLNGFAQSCGAVRNAMPALFVVRILDSSRHLLRLHDRTPWPMRRRRRLVGRDEPAVVASNGLFFFSSGQDCAASSSADPPISPIID